MSKKPVLEWGLASVTVKLFHWGAPQPQPVKRGGQPDIKV